LDLVLAVCIPRFVLVLRANQTGDYSSICKQIWLPLVVYMISDRFANHLMPSPRLFSQVFQTSNPCDNDYSAKGRTN
jgi:hypothetical protein